MSSTIITVGVILVIVILFFIFKKMIKFAITLSILVILGIVIYKLIMTL